VRATDEQGGDSKRYNFLDNPSQPAKRSAKHGFSVSLEFNNAHARAVHASMLRQMLRI